MEATLVQEGDSIINLPLEPEARAQKVRHRKLHRPWDEVTRTGTRDRA